MKAAVAYMNLFDNNLILEVVNVNKKDWKDALYEHSYLKQFSKEEAVGWLSDNYNDAQSDAFNREIVFAVEWI